MFVLPDLPYAYDDLAPVMSAHTLRVHHDQLHAGYVRELNDIIRINSRHVPELARMSLMEILELAHREKAEDLAHAAGGHFNHSLLWSMMRAPQRGAPLINTLEKILGAYSSVASFKDAVRDAASRLNGSGWVWVSITPHGNLTLDVLANQQTVIPLGNHPVLGFDFWEHAYLFDYSADRSAYLDNYWSIINWSFVEDLVRLCL